MVFTKLSHRLSFFLVVLIAAVVIVYHLPIVRSDSIHLNRDQVVNLRANCLNIQARILGPSRDELLSTQKQKYEAVLADSEYYLRLIGFKSKQIGQDASEINLALVKNQRLVKQFKIEVEEYRTIITEIVNMDCKPNLSLFAEKLVLAKRQHEKLMESGQSIQRFIAVELIDYLDSFEENLIEA